MNYINIDNKIKLLDLEAKLGTPLFPPEWSIPMSRQEELSHLPQTTTPVDAVWVAKSLEHANRLRIDAFSANKVGHPIGALLNVVGFQIRAI